MTIELEPPRGCLLVTGAASGIGRAATAALLEEGWSVMALDRDEAALEQLGREFAADRGLSIHVVDVANLGEIDQFVAAFPPELALRGLVCSAARGDNTPFIDLSLPSVRSIFEVNFFGTLSICQLVARRMAAHGGGSIVNVTSVSGVRANAGRAAYGASKAALELVSKVMAVELAPFRIRVNTLAPGPTLTAMAAELHAGAERDRLLDAVPMGRYGTPNEIAQGIAYLIDDRRSSFVTGTTLYVDGGMYSAGSFELARGALDAEPE